MVHVPLHNTPDPNLCDNLSVISAFEDIMDSNICRPKACQISDLPTSNPSTVKDTGNQTEFDTTFFLLEGAPTLDKPRKIGCGVSFQHVLGFTSSRLGQKLANKAT